MSGQKENSRATGFFSGVFQGAAVRTYLGRRKLATVAAATMAIFIGYHVVFGHNGLTIFWQKRQEAQQLSARLHSLQSENTRLKTHVDHLQSDPDSIEHQAREQLHYARPGEVIYTLPDAPVQDSDTTK